MLDDWGTRSARWAGIRSEVLDIRGTAVHVLRTGDAGTGTPQLLVHGLGGSATNWLDVMAGLAPHGPLVAPDLPGFGRTRPPRPAATRLTGNAHFLRALLAHLGWDRAQVHGSSMGGAISVLLADLEPSRIDRLVLVSPALPASRRDAVRIDRDTVMRFGPFLVPSLGQRVLGRTYERMTPQQVHDDTTRYVMADPARVSDALTAVGLENVRYGREQDWRLPGFSWAAASLVRAVIGRRQLEGAVARIDAPTLVLWGDQDRLIRRPVIESIRRLRPDWPVQELAGVGHAPMMETPDDYLRSVAAWMAGAPSVPSVS